MLDIFALAMQFVRYWEGGWSNHKADPGGLTKWGVTIKTIIAKALDFNGDGKVNEKDLADMTPAQAESLYRTDYFDKVRGADLPPAVAILAFDAAVNQGPGRAGRWLQETAGMTGKDVDGVIGDQSVARIARAFAADERAFLREFQVRRALHYSSLSSFVTFGRGWFRRLIDGTIEAARLGRAAETLTVAVSVDTREVGEFLADVAANIEAGGSTAARLAAAAESLAERAREVAAIAGDAAAGLRDRAEVLIGEDGGEVAA